MPISIPDKSILDIKCDIAFVWNGAKGIFAEIAEGLREKGKTVFVMERGFFDRFNYTQIDKAGFNHRAAWASKLLSAVYHGQQGAEHRLTAVCPSVERVAARKRGYVLVLGQVAHDAQLFDSEIRHVEALTSLVCNSLPSDIEVKVRPHPETNWKPAKADMLLGGSLEDAIDGARFCVTINSNSGNDAIARGCPVLALGPSLYGIARAARRTTVADFAKDLQWMLDGWEPAVSTLAYLEYLASRQWNAEEIASGEVLESLINGKI